MSQPGAAFSLREIGLRIGERTVLHPLTLELPAGAVTGLLGHNGSGKSTLMKILARQLQPDSGEIDLFGTPLAAHAPRRLARSLAYLPQHTPDTDGLTVRELAALGRYPWHGPFGRVGDLDRQKTETALAMTNLLPLADRLVDTLSGGERQRAFLAMLVAQDAVCLLLDEPISALDVAQQIDVMAFVRRQATEHGRSVVVILHDLNIAARFCDRLVVLSRGRVAAQGTPDALLHPDRLEALYGVPMGVFPHPASGRPVTYVL
ncbi:ABC transporter ATP-binding protein [Thalassobaculum salexigens]|uniref:ABC transporter ATP-binding protein n=1 Tax=Thalassobaculum salexigens TaxID=455360 RepID=UPI00248D85D8|nr:ATP-binding cassette domain-containing protein [Thalassobaculum salexigens]